ncbi:MAG: hypothetical protein WC840_03145, partial [Candidatus Peribacteraceae bacterium]
GIYPRLNDNGLFLPTAGRYLLCIIYIFLVSHAWIKVSPHNLALIPHWSLDIEHWSFSPDQAAMIKIG